MCGRGEEEGGRESERERMEKNCDERRAGGAMGGSEQRCRV